MIIKQVPEFPLLNNDLELDNKAIVQMLKKMFLIRTVEQRIASRVEQKEIITPCHLYIGEEASAVGVCSALRESDYVFSNHRSHGHFLAKGGDVNELFGEIYCKKSGCSGGRGGSMHLCDPGKGLLGSSSIVAGGLGYGLGPALRSKIMGEDNVSVIFHGDCVPEEGIWSESLNFAAVKNLPVIFVLENNLYAASAPLEDRRVFDNISTIAGEYGLHTDIVDGNDVFAVNKVATEAVKRARNGEGPQFIENRTYRWLGHVGYRDDIDVGLRNQQELDWWKLRCPIQNLEKKVLAEGILSKKQLDKLYEEIQVKVNKAEELAIAESKPTAETLLLNVYQKEVALP